MLRKHEALVCSAPGQVCGIPSTGHVQASSCTFAQLPLLVQQSHIALSHAHSYPQTASVLCLNFIFDNAQLGAFKGPL